MNKFARMIDVLDLYSDTDTLLTAEDIAQRLEVSRPTAFRYVRELTVAGFLANYSGRYSLGARIITLDYRIRQSDPVLKAARAVMKALSAETGCSTVLCRMYNEEVINVHDEVGYGDPGVSFSGRGRSDIATTKTLSPSARTGPPSRPTMPKSGRLGTMSRIRSSTPIPWALQPQ
jgi:DNA-binding IclR family transcriptional regulator